VASANIEATRREAPIADLEFPWQTIAELVEDTRREMAPDAGIEIDGRLLTYSEIRQRARIIATNLRAAGLHKGNCVASLMTSRIEVVLTWFGSTLAGAVWSPLNVSLVRDDLASVVGNAGPKVIIADVQGAAKLLDPSVARHLPTARFLVGDGEGSTAEGFAPFEELLEEPAAPYSAVDLAPSDPALIIYTGGSTGLPKGVVLPHFACLCAGYRYVEAFGAKLQDRHFATSPLFHAGGLFVGLLGPMVAGMRTTIDRHFSASAYWKRVRDTRATLINPPGVTLTMLCRQPPSSDDRRHGVRAALGLTGQLPPQVPTEFTARFGIGLVNLYALTEASGALIVYNPEGSAKPESNGTGGRWAEIAISDKHGRFMPVGRVGRILLRPKIPYTFMLGYHNDPEATINAFRNLWLNTGDLGFLDEEGFLYFKGREVHWLRRRGENISAYEVEQIIARYPGVAEAIVVGVPSELGEEEVKVFITLQPDATIEPSQLIVWCMERMAAFKTPRYVEFIDSFPRSSVKPDVDRTKLKCFPNEMAWDREKVFGRKPPSGARAASL
jgi:carnitine-CoA ligase